MVQPPFRSAICLNSSPTNRSISTQVASPTRCPSCQPTDRPELHAQTASRMSPRYIRTTPLVRCAIPTVNSLRVSEAPKSHFVTCFMSLASGLQCCEVDSTTITAVSIVIVLRCALLNNMRQFVGDQVPSGRRVWIVIAWREMNFIPFRIGVDAEQCGTVIMVDPHIGEFVSQLRLHVMAEGTRQGNAGAEFGWVWHCTDRGISLNTCSRNPEKTQTIFTRYFVGSGGPAPVGDLTVKPCEPIESSTWTSICGLDSIQDRRVDIHRGVAGPNRDDKRGPNPRSCWKGFLPSTSNRTIAESLGEVDGADQYRREALAAARESGDPGGRQSDSHACLAWVSPR